MQIQASHGSQPNLSMRKLEQFRVRVPSKDIQERIVNVLDNFESICNDLNIGLPAEILDRAALLGVGIGTGHEPVVVLPADEIDTLRLD